MVQTHSQQKYCKQVWCVPVTQALPVHPAEHWHLLGETQDPWLLSQPWEQIAVKEINNTVTESMNPSVND